jgi:hypothetical protein
MLWSAAGKQAHASLHAGRTCALAPALPAADGRRCALRRASMERLYHSSMDEVASWRDKHDATKKAQRAHARPAACLC